ncbi:unnamed protein product [Urochloa humidicola]
MPARGRRLTLAPAVRAKLRPRPDAGEADAEPPRDIAKARAELSAMVEAVAAASSRPKPQHAVEYRFWATGSSDGEDSDAEEVDEEIIAEEEDLSTPEFVAAAAEVGFSVQDLQQAEKELSSSSKVLFRGTHWLRFWALLQHTDDKEDLVKACQYLESRAMKFFASHGWPFILRIGQ